MEYKAELTVIAGWIIPWLVAFPKISQEIVENLGGMLMPAISTVVPVVGSFKFVQIAGILGK